VSEKNKKSTAGKRRQFTEDFKRDAVQMLLDGHSAASIAQRLGLTGTGLLYRWKRQQFEQTGPVAASLDSRVQTLEAEVRRLERERDILKKALSIFSRSD
jgi:transposase